MMTSLTKTVGLTLVLAASLSLTSCQTAADPDANKPTPSVTSSGERVSTQPWNRPQSWEGQGPLGAVMQQNDPSRW